MIYTSCTLMLRQHLDEQWGKSSEIHDDDEIAAAHEVGYEFFHVVHRFALARMLHCT